MTTNQDSNRKECKRQSDLAFRRVGITAYMAPGSVWWLRALTGHYEDPESLRGRIRDELIKIPH